MAIRRGRWPSPPVSPATLAGYSPRAPGVAAPCEHERVVVLSVIGLVLELAGLAIVLQGLDELSSDLFPGRPLPHRAAWRWIRQRIGPKPQPRVVQGSVALDGVAAVGTARGVVTKARPSDDATLSEWNEYWESRLGNLSERIDLVTMDLRDADRKTQERLAAESSARSEGDRKLEERLRVVVGGEGGSGLVKTWWGLAVAGAGTLVSGLAGMLR